MQHHVTCHHQHQINDRTRCDRNFPCMLHRHPSCQKYNSKYCQQHNQHQDHLLLTQKRIDHCLQFCKDLFRSALFCHRKIYRCTAQLSYRQ